MSEALPEDPQKPSIPEPEARSPVSPPVQNTAPTTDDTAGHSSDAEPLAQDVVGTQTRGFTVQRGGRMAGTAERIGIAVGTAKREVRRRLELVRRPQDPILSAETRAHQLTDEDVDRGSRMVQEIEDEVTRLRDTTAHKMEDWLVMAERSVMQLRHDARRAIVEVRKTADKFPLQTIGAISGVCFALGFALRFRRPRHG